jgi:excisionase family DNA binding protein
VTTRAYLSPADVATQLGVSVDTVLVWIARGEMVAVSASRNPRSRKPRWRIAPSDLDLFLVARRNRPAPVRAARRPRRDDHVIKFF